MRWICRKIKSWFKKKPVPRVPECIEWGHTIGDPHDCFVIHRYIPTEHGYGPTNADGSDRDGDFWTISPDPDGLTDQCRGKPGSSFIWCDAPDLTTRLPITSTHVLEALKRSGKITDEDILSAKAAVKLMGII